MKILVVAEKPSVAREIARVLGVRGQSAGGAIKDDRYVVTWALGHLVNIAEPAFQNRAWAGRWSLDGLPMIPGTFVLRVLEERKRQFDLVAGFLRSSKFDYVINATDAGREGELIFRRIYKLAESSLPIKRLWASDMTEEGLKKALASLVDGEEKRNLGLASFARAEADWLIGMNFSRLFTLKADTLITVGRVQSPVLKMLVDRLRAIENFQAENYWTVDARLRKDDSAFDAQWFAPPKYKESRIDDNDKALRLVRACSDAPALVLRVSRKKGRQKPPLLFDLTTLQREANTRHGFSAGKTLMIAQSLYETRKVITYPRTDSRFLTSELFKEILKYFRAVYPNFPEIAKAAVDRIKGSRKAFHCVNDKKVSDHHAIIPTSRKTSRESLDADEWKIYEMLCRRFAAAFMEEARFSSSTVWIEINSERFKSTGKIFDDKGWLSAEPWRAARDNPLPDLAKGDSLDVLSVKTTKHRTKPPSHFTDASLLAAMETAGKLVEDEELRDAMKHRGLGTPATRAQIIETLIGRKYVEKRGKKLIATLRGCEAIDLVSAHLPDLVSPELTGEWEKRLKDIESGSWTYPEFMKSIRKMVRDGVTSIKAVSIAGAVSTSAAAGDVAALGACPLCGAKVLENRKAFGCSRWRSSDGGCRFTIWKNLYGGQIGAAVVAELLEKGRTGEKIDFRSKSGRSYQARLVLKNGRPVLDFSE